MGWKDVFIIEGSSDNDLQLLFTFTGNDDVMNKWV